MFYCCCTFVTWFDPLSIEMITDENREEREKLHVGRDVGCCMLHVALLHEKSPIEKPTDYPSASPPPKKNRNGFCHNISKTTEIREI